MQPDRWLGIELRHLAALQAVAGERSFHAAAARLGYSQSAVSQQIATLERIVGGKLIERPGGPRTVFLTDLGELVLRHAEAIVARLQAAQADAEAMLGGDLGALRVGSYQSVGEQILPALVPRFQADHAGVEISLIESESDDALLTGIETATGKPRRRPSFSLRASSAPNSNVGLSRSSRPPADTALIARHGCGAGRAVYRVAPRGTVVRNLHHVAVGVVLAGALVFAPAAGAAVTASTVTSPADGAGFDVDLDDPQEITVSGTATAENPGAD